MKILSVTKNLKRDSKDIFYFIIFYISLSICVKLIYYSFHKKKDEAQIINKYNIINKLNQIKKFFLKKFNTKTKTEI